MRRVCVPGTLFVHVQPYDLEDLRGSGTTHTEIPLRRLAHVPRTKTGPS
jgi:hypothetical protein